MNNIIGFPGETRDLIFETIELNRQIPAYDALTASVFVPYHGTVLRDLAVQKGYIDKNTIVCDMHHSILKMPQLSTEELDGLLKTFPLYVHFDKSLWKDIKRAEKNDIIGTKIFNELKEKYREEAFALDQDEKNGSLQKIRQLCISKRIGFVVQIFLNTNLKCNFFVM